MKASRVLAGLIIVLLGIAILLSNFDIVSFDWGLIFRMWPVLLILAGISVLVPNERAKVVLYIVTIVLVVVWIFSAFSRGSRSFRHVFDNKSNVRIQEFSVEMDRGVQHAVFTLDGGAGSFSIQDTTGSVVSARTESNVGSYNFDSDKNGGTETMNLSMKNGTHDWHFGHSENNVKIRLNSKPDWNLNINVGACAGDFDLTPYRVRSANIDAGASDITVRLGEKSDTTNLDIDTGISKLTIYVPAASGCQIDDKAELSAKSFDGFTKNENGTYRTSNFKNTSKKIFVSLDAGVSSIRVVRY